MSFQNYFRRDVLGEAIDVGADTRQFQRTIRLIKQNQNKSGLLGILQRTRQESAPVIQQEQGSY